MRSVLEERCYLIYIAREMPSPMAQGQEKLKERINVSLYLTFPMTLSLEAYSLHVLCVIPLMIQCGASQINIFCVHE
jgi:hypothetical protein